LQGLEGGDFSSVTMPKARSEAKKNTTRPLLACKRSWFDDLSSGRRGWGLVGGGPPQKEKFFGVSPPPK
jgi:hypothetical protein